MKYQNFIMRILCLLLILAAVVGYNSMQKKDTQAQESQEITALTKRVEKLEEQNTEILSALEEAAKNQEAAIAQAQRDAKDKDDAAKEDAEGADAADTEESDDSENVYKDGTYTGSAQGFGGAITVQVTLANDEITDIQVTSAPGEDSAYLSQGEGVISSIISAQILFGRHFCGYACAFGSLGDAMYELTVFIRQKVFHKKGRHGYPEKAVRILQKVKYVLLAFLLLSILTGWYASLQGMSPWDVFSMLTARKLPNASYKIGIILLVLILIGMCTQERFFCQFLCPMGAVFAMMPILPSALFNRNREKCPSKCGLCRKRCPAHLEIDGDTPLSGECICCHACQVTCPRKNIQIGPVKEREMVKE